MAIREYVLSLDDYKNPKVFEGENAIAILLIRLFLMNPGDIETHPNMGIGLYKNYRNMWMDDIPALQLNAEKQIAQYLPMLQNVSINITQKEKKSKIILIDIQVENTIYSLISDNTSKTLSLDEMIK